MFQSKKEVLDKLFSLQRFGIKPGLERTLSLLDFLGNPHLKTKFVHAAGTNGKGSVCSTIFSILFEAGYRVGLYTSPHIFDFSERIRINEKCITEDEIIEFSNIIMPYALEISATFFEVTTAMAFYFFEKNKVDVAVIETGMGGRFDSTNVIIPLLSIITKIDMDHQEYLGDTIERIAGEKAGIIKANIPVVIGKNIDQVITILKSKASLENSQFIDTNIIGNIELKQIQTNQNLNSIYEVKDYNSKENNKTYELEYLAGKHQSDNLLTLLSAIDILKNTFPVSIENIQKGVKNVRNNAGLKFRLEMLDIDYKGESHKIYADVSHNPNSIEFAFDTLNNANLNDLNILFSVLEDKDITPIANYILKYLSNNISDNLSTNQNSNQNKLVLTQLNNSRAIKIEKLFETFEKIAENYNLAGVNLKDRIIVINDINSAFDYLINEKKLSGKSFIILGSFYLFDELKDILDK